MNYTEAGVNIEEGYRAVNFYKKAARSTALGAGAALQPLNGIGSFAGMVPIAELLGKGSAALPKIDDPVLVSGTDGVGTKLDIAFAIKKYDTVGIDCVAMSVNDILCHGAQPLFFLDYVACGKLDAAVAASLVDGVAAGCRDAGCLLLGGETAEMPGFYDIGKYDLAGFAVGIVDRKRIIDGSGIEAGDALIGLGSSGPHSNGFSLIRKVITDFTEDFEGRPIGEALLEPTRIYVKPVLELVRTAPVLGMAHITGGGFYENIPRMLPAGLAAHIKRGSWSIPPIFGKIAKAASLGLESNEMYNTYNMGIGFVIAMRQAFAEEAVRFLRDRGVKAWNIGSVAAAEGDAVARLVLE
jgi:phosphoribosylformylglycinamidine cyclo-ligase